MTPEVQALLTRLNALSPPDQAKAVTAALAALDVMETGDQSRAQTDPAMRRKCEEQALGRFRVLCETTGIASIFTQRLAFSGFNVEPEKLRDAQKVDAALQEPEVEALKNWRTGKDGRSPRLSLARLVLDLAWLLPAKTLGLDIAKAMRDLENGVLDGDNILHAQTVSRERKAGRPKLDDIERAVRGLLNACAFYMREYLLEAKSTGRWQGQVPSIGDILSVYQSQIPREARLTKSKRWQNRTRTAVQLPPHVADRIRHLARDHARQNMPPMPHETVESCYLETCGAVLSELHIDPTKVI